MPICRDSRTINRGAAQARPGAAHDERALEGDGRVQGGRQAGLGARITRAARPSRSAGGDQALKLTILPDRRPGEHPADQQGGRRDPRQ